MSHLCGVVRPG